MNDLKNILIAWTSSTSAVFTAIETKTLITLFSAVILPIVLFAIGKTVDVIVQIHLRRRQERSGKKNND